MIDIYDEVGYIKNVLEHGLSASHWIRDAKLLIRYYKSTGIKKSIVKKLIGDKCEIYVPGWNKYTDFKKLNELMDKTWDDNTPLREIRELVIPKEALQWFEDLRNLEFTPEQLVEYQGYYPHLKLKQKYMTDDRIKFLFTLYVWIRIQSVYLADKPYMLYLKNYKVRFLHDANLPKGFRFEDERNFLYNLGYIRLNQAIGIDVTFVKDNPVFSTPITDSNSLRIIGDDLYNCRTWIEKQMYKWFVCEKCGKVVIDKGEPRRGRPQKYCKECGALVNKHANPNRKQTEELYKNIKCSECGKYYIENKYTPKEYRKCRECKKILGINLEENEV